MQTPFIKGIALATLISFPVSAAYAQTAQTPPPAPSAAAQPADTAQPVAQESVGSDAGYGVGAALASVFYIPAKITYAGLGLLTGGLGWVLSGGRSDVANN